MQKKLLISLGLFLLILIIGGHYAYNYYLIPDPEFNTQLDEQFGADFFEFISFITEDYDLEDNPSSNPSDEAEEESSPDSEQKDSDQSNSKQPSATPSNNLTDQKSEAKQVKPLATTRFQNAAPTEESIINTYVPKLKQLEALAIERLDTLFDSGLQEYNQKKNEGTLDKSELSKKYIQASKKLESGVDEVFDQITAEMKEMLTNNNYPTKIIEDIQKEYNDAKSSKMAEFLHEARSQ